VNGSPDEPQDDVVFDEAFIAAAKFKEPAARERQGSRYVRWQAERRRRALRKEQARLRRRRLLGPRLLTALIVLGVVALALVLNFLDPLGLHPSTPKAVHITLEPQPQPAQPTSGTAADPFQGSPAETYKNNMDGYTPPATAGATGGVPAAGVQQLLNTAKSLFYYAELDQNTLFHGDTDAFARQLDPEQRRQFTATPRNKALDWLTVFSPGSAALTGPNVRVNGTTTLSAATRQGEHGAQADLNYVVVYPLHQPGRPQNTIRVVADFHGSVFRSAVDGRTWVYDWSASYAGILCGLNDGYVHPAFGSQQGPVKPSGTPTDPYSPAPTPSPEPSGCHPDTRT
jgi:hypothetical protein